MITTKLPAFIEIRFEGASKQNLDKEGVEGIFRTANSNPLHFFT